MSLLPVLAPHSPVALAYGRLGDVRDLTPALCAIESAKAIGVMNKENPRKAARVIAGWLSTREAVWWAALCQSQLLEIPGIQPETEILKAVIEWVRQPGEVTRAPFNNQQMKPASVSLGHLVAAITLTRDSLSPVEKSPVPCPAGLAHRMVALSVLAAADEWPEPGRAACLAHFLGWMSPIASSPGMRPPSRNTPDCGMIPTRSRAGRNWATSGKTGKRAPQKGQGTDWPGTRQGGDGPAGPPILRQATTSMPFNRYNAVLG